MFIIKENHELTKIEKSSFHIYIKYFTIQSTQRSFTILPLIKQSSGFYI